MAWGAVDDRFHIHRKVLRLRRSKHYTTAVAMWTLSLSWCCSQEQERFTGEVPADVLFGFGLPEWETAADALVMVGLWEKVSDELFRFHDWSDWNGIAGKEYRSKEQARLRKQAERKRKCDSGQHDRHCPSDYCPKKAGHSGSRDPGTGRDGTGRAEPGHKGGEAGWIRDADTSEVINLETGEVVSEVVNLGPDDPNSSGRESGSGVSECSRPSLCGNSVCRKLGMCEAESTAWLPDARAAR